MKVPQDLMLFVDAAHLLAQGLREGKAFDRMAALWNREAKREGKPETWTAERLDAEAYPRMLSYLRQMAITGGMKTWGRDQTSTLGLMSRADWEDSTVAYKGDGRPQIYLRHRSTLHTLWEDIRIRERDARTILAMNVPRTKGGILLSGKKPGRKPIYGANVRSVVNVGLRLMFDTVGLSTMLDLGPRKLEKEIRSRAGSGVKLPRKTTLRRWIRSEMEILKRVGGR